MNISDTVQPDSTQINAEDALGGPLTVTVTDVERGTPEQPVNIAVAEYPGRAYRPNKTMRRLLLEAWGDDTSAYVGRRLRLYRDPEVTFGRDKPGGLRISHLSHIDKPIKIALTVSRGKRAIFTVLPLEDAPATPEPTEAQVAASTDQNELREYWQHAGPERRAQITARVNELKEES